MFQQVIPRLFLWLVSIWAVLTIGIIGCGGDDDDNEWVGTWAIESSDGVSIEQAFVEGFGFEEGEEGIDLSLVTNSWTFNSDGTMEAELAIKFEVKEQGLELFSGEGSIKMMGTYSLSGSSYTLIPIEVEGTGLLEGEAEPVGPTDEDTGTWSISGNTLTLNYDDGSTMVLTKK